MVPFKSLVTVSCSHIVTMTVSYIISETKRDIGRKSRFFHTPLHSTPHCSPRPNIVIQFGVENYNHVATRQ